MIWLIAIAVIVLIMGKFLYDTQKLNSKIKKEGGMANKYNELINYILDFDPLATIMSEKADYICIGGDTTIYELLQTFGTLTVQWKHNSNVFGKHKMGWTFPEYGNQEEMMQKIISDLYEYQNKMALNMINI